MEYKLDFNPMCICMMNYDTIDHKLFECALNSRNSAQKLKIALEKEKVLKPYIIRDIIAISLKEKNINVLREICDFLKSNEISI